jgi:hypothetical protein
MTVQENIDFLRDQRSTFEDVKNELTQAIRSQNRQVDALSEDISDTQSELRMLRQDLTTDDEVPSAAAIARRLQLEGRLDSLVGFQAEFLASMDDLEELAEEWGAVTEELRQVVAESMSEADRSKLSRLTELFREQLALYAFGSTAINELEISRETYRPTFEGFDLGFDLSASDMIRVIWAYMMGLLEVSREFPTNHPGVVGFDEPRQQATRELSFRALLLRASSAAEHGQQVLFATSEPRTDVERMLADKPYELVAFDTEKILTPEV